MAKHKQPTEVTVLPIQERSEFQEWVHKHWMKGAVAAAVISVLILGSRWMKSQEESGLADDWNAFAAEVGIQEFFGTVRLSSGRDQAQALEADTASQVAQSLEDTTVGPWAYLVAASTLAGERRYAEAKQALDVLASEYADHSLNTLQRSFDVGGTRTTAVEHMRSRIEALESWETGRDNLFENPAPPADSPRVTIRTNMGEVVVALYSERAPEHCANFVKLAEEGYYANSKFHRVVPGPGSLIQGGDPNSIDGEPDTWGHGDPDYKIPRKVAEDRAQASRSTLAPARLVPITCDTKAPSADSGRSPAGI